MSFAFRTFAALFEIRLDRTGDSLGGDMGAPMSATPGGQNRDSPDDLFPRIIKMAPVSQTLLLRLVLWIDMY
jgi:hypothetical protein